MREFVDVTRELGCTQHVTQNLNRSGGSAIDARTTRHEGYAMSQHARPRIEPAFGWLKTIAWIRKVKLRGLENVDAEARLMTATCLSSAPRASAQPLKRPRETSR